MSRLLRQGLPAAALLLAALIHLLPLAGLTGGEALQRLYGLPQLPDAASELLLRHRAVMFGLFGLALLAALWRPAWTRPACWMVLASDLAFLLLYLTAPTLPAALGTVAVADLLSITALILVLLLYRQPQRQAG